MARPLSETLTRREAQIMEVLWTEGPCPADRIREALPDRPHDSTVRTLLRILETKGCVKHSVQGKAFIYRPAVKRAKPAASEARPPPADGRRFDVATSTVNRRTDSCRTDCLTAKGHRCRVAAKISLAGSAKWFGPHRRRSEASG